MVSAPVNKSLLNVLNGQREKISPVWMMRQAGRYLPEYRATREKAGSILNLCFNPELAAEVTLQPIKRFGFDAAILFSDILVIPYALGRRVEFVTGEGPKLDPIADPQTAQGIRKDVDHGVLLGPIYETIQRVKADLPANVTFLGFCGAPWTRGDLHDRRARHARSGTGADVRLSPSGRVQRSDPDAGEGIVRISDPRSSRPASMRFRSSIPGLAFCRRKNSRAGASRRCGRSFSNVRDEIPNAKIIAFPRGAGSGLERYVTELPIDAVGLDWMIDKTFARERIQSIKPVQGNLDPMALIAGGRALDESVDAVMRAFSGWAFHLQSRPRHHAANPDRACGTDAETGAGLTSVIHRAFVPCHLNVLGYRY